MNVGEIYKVLNDFAPFATAESYDNVGLLVGDKNARVTKALIALDCTHEVVEEAVSLGAQLIITHHPIIFSPLKCVLADSVVYQAIKAGISVICAHTNLDMAKGGVNDALAKELDLCDLQDFDITSRKNYNKVIVFVPTGYEKAVSTAMCRQGAGSIGNYCNCSYSSEGLGHFKPIEGANPFIGQIGEAEHQPEVKVEVVCPKEKTFAVLEAMREAHPYETPAYDVFENQAITDVLSIGRIGTLKTSMNASELALFAKGRLGCKGVFFVNTGEKPIRTVAICGGAGGSLLPLAAQLGADALITGDLKHNLWLDAKKLNIALMDCGHYYTERVVLKPLQGLLCEACREVAFTISQTEDAAMDLI